MAKHVEIRLALPVVAPLVEFILPFLDPESAELPSTPDLKGIDRDLREFWRDDLVSAHQADVSFFRDLFGEAFHSTGIIEFPEEACDAVVRACASVRLRLRAEVLTTLKDEALEGGELDFETLSPNEKTGFMAYVFLASFQEILIRHMDPEIGEG